MSVENFTSGYNGSEASKRFSLIAKKLLKFWAGSRGGWERGGAGRGAYLNNQCKLLKFVRNKTLSVNFSLDYGNNQVNFKDEANFSGRRTIDLKPFIKINSLC